MPFLECVSVFFFVKAFVLLCFDISSRWNAQWKPSFFFLEKSLFPTNDGAWQRVHKMLPKEHAKKRKETAVLLSLRILGGCDRGPQFCREVYFVSFVWENHFVQVPFSNILESFLIMVKAESFYRHNSGLVMSTVISVIWSSFFAHGIGNTSNKSNYFLYDFMDCTYIAMGESLWYLSSCMLVRKNQTYPGKRPNE